MSDGLPDPDPSNIDGKIVEAVSNNSDYKHVFHWSHIAIAVAVIVVIAFVWTNYDLGGDDEQEGIGA